MMTTNFQSIDMHGTMESNTFGWVIINIGHPRTGSQYVNSSTFRRTRKEAIKDFISGSASDWRYWYRKYNFRCVKAESTIKVEIPAK